MDISDETRNQWYPPSTFYVKYNNTLLFLCARCALCMMVLFKRLVALLIVPFRWCGRLWMTANSISRVNNLYRHIIPPISHRFATVRWGMCAFILEVFEISNNHMTYVRLHSFQISCIIYIVLFEMKIKFCRFIEANIVF